jgi:hypothetical protein
MPKAILLPFAVLALLASCFSAGAAAESLVPPGNSAASQYTETFPTSKGEEDEQGKKKSGVTPAQVLGAGKAHQLEGKGAAGKAVADFAAESAPTSVDAAAGEETGAGDNDSGHHHAAGKQGSADKAAGGGGKEKSEGSGAGGGGQSPSGGSGSGGASASGSSGIGEVVSQATGTSSGSLGLLLPLILILVVVWSAAYFWRHRQQRVV